MPSKQVTGFNKRWRQFLKRYAARADKTLTTAGQEVVDRIIEILQETAPYTQGNLLGKGTPYSSEVRFRAVDFKPTGFVPFRRETGGKRTLIISNSAWNIYGKSLEEGIDSSGRSVSHNSTLGGRSWDPGFVARAISQAKRETR